MTELGLRDMIQPEIEEPIDADREQGDRRNALRYERRTEGILRLEDSEHPITCLNVSFGGVKVCARDGFVPELGDLAEIEVQFGDSTFRDDCLVVETSPGTRGTIIHLAM